MLVVRVRANPVRNVEPRVVVAGDVVPVPCMLQDARDESEDGLAPPVRPRGVTAASKHHRERHRAYQCETNHSGSCSSAHETLQTDSGAVAHASHSLCLSPQRWHTQ
jgi:hypothetical protein